MNTLSDKHIHAGLLLLIFSHFFIWIIGMLTGKAQLAVTSINAIEGAGILLYWLQKQLRITQHHIEVREIVVLSGELIVVSAALYSIIFNGWDSWVMLFQYIVFGIHFSALIAFTIFMFTFKMKKLI